MTSSSSDGAASAHSAPPPTHLHSATAHVVFAKLGAALFWAGWVYILSSENRLSWRTGFALPFVALVAFHLSLAVITVQAGAVRYRRLFRWTHLDLAEVVSTGKMWPLLIGYIELNRFVPPWGKLYFVLDEPVRPKLFGRQESAIVNFLNSEPTGASAQASEATADTRLFLAHGVAFTAGVLVSVVNFQWAKQFSIFDRHTFWSFTNRTDVAAGACLAFVILLVFQYRQPRAWTLTFLAGMALTRVFINALS
jgi:hypothetical protein